MNLALEVVRNNTELREEIIQILIKYKSDSIVTQTEGVQKLVAMLPAIEKDFNIKED